MASQARQDRIIVGTGLKADEIRPYQYGWAPSIPRGRPTVIMDGFEE